jgi:hypothetical protein
MSHRSGSPLHRASARDLSVLVLGVLLVIAGIGLATFGSSVDFPGAEPRCVAMEQLP